MTSSLATMISSGISFRAIVKNYLAFVLVLGVPSVLAEEYVPVDDKNFAYAMTDLAMQKEFVQGADNSWNHHRRPMPLDEQPAPLMNRDTLYSFAILDGRGDVAITLPENDGRYMSLHVMNHDHVTYKVFYGPGRYVIPASETSDFYFANVRMQLDTSDPRDVKKVNDYQDQLKVEHLNGYKASAFQVTNWNMEDFERVRGKYVVLAQEQGVTGTMGTVDNPVSMQARNRGVAIATGLLPDKDAVYFTAKHEAELGKAYKATFAVPELANTELGFFSLTIYGDDQYLKTDRGSILNNKTIKLNPGGKTFDIWFVPESEFGQGKYENELIIPTAPFWTCFRVYMPGSSVLSGGYELPALIQVSTESNPDQASGVGPNGIALASSPAFVTTGGQPVTMDNVVRAETAKYFAEETIQSGPNTFRHERNGIQLDNQTVIRSNFDLIYSYGVFDASESLEISVPPYDLYHVVHVFDENHVTIDVVYPGQTRTITPDQLTYGDHVYLFMRTQPPSTDEAGMEKLRERQDSVVVKAGSADPYVSEVKYDLASFNSLRGELIARAPREDVVYKGFIESLDDIISPYYQMTNLAGWGGLPARHAYYFVVAPADAGAKQGNPSSMTFSPPPLQTDRAGYWSLTVYNADGWVTTDPFKISSLEAKPNDDGTYTLNFNGPDGSINNLQVPANWNALFRCYLPKSLDEIVAFQKDIDNKHKVLSR